LELLKIDLHKTYSTKERVVQVDCQAQFELGKTSAIYGKSGFVKSTVLRIIAGLEKADKGCIYFNEEKWFEDVSKTNLSIAARNIGFVFQDFNLFPNMTVEKNLKYATGNEITPEIKHLLEVTDLTKLLKSYPRDLSGGERQRASIVRALCQTPKLLLLDEPFSALDDEAIGDLIHEIKLIQAEIETTVILVSHRKYVILEMADTVVYMSKGEQTKQGIPANLLQRKF
jgi:molybdate transport system ATP-binding protein